MIVACWQATSHCGNPSAPLDRIAEVAGRAAAAGAELLVTPELSATGYPRALADVDSVAEPADGPIARAMADIAATANIAIAYGWPEWKRDGVRNSVALVGSDGSTLAVYNKVHLYGHRERAAFVPGDEAVVQARIGDVTVGLLVCFDVEFPEPVRAHAVAGTDLLVVPTALESPWDMVADTVVPTRAFESQLYLCYANWAGPEGDGHFCGRSRIVGPDGRGEPAGGSGEELLLADVDHERLRAARAVTPYLRDRRPDLYRDLL